MLIQADAFHLPYPDNLFHACVTSPPYWGLRKYAGEQGEEPLGLEATPELYIKRMVEILREVWRVTRPDAVVWINMGDCYYNYRPGKGSGLKKQTIARTDREQPVDYSPRRAGKFDGIGEGSLMLMPHRLAIALQQDGWIVRNDLVWFKRNPMPESISGWHWHRHRLKDENDKWYDCSGCEKCLHDNPLFPPLHFLRKSSWRHTRAHEYVFQLVKGMQYFCNQEAVREGLSEGTMGRYNHDFKPIWTEGKGNADPSGGGYRGDSTSSRPTSGRNPRSVLDVPTAPYKGAHYATFPPKLIAPLIRASVPRRCCPECGMAWAAVVEKPSGMKRNRDVEGGLPDGMHGHGIKQLSGKTWADEMGSKITVTDYRPTCDCGREDHVPGIVLDIFAGSGTVPMVANELGLRSVGMDISYPYLDEQARYRVKWGEQKTKIDDLPLFSTLSPNEGY